MRFLISLFSCLALDGCIGVGVIHDRTVHVESPTGTYQLRERAAPEYYNYAGSGHPVRTKSDLRAYWGEPDSTWFDGQTEKWRYNRNISWVGFHLDLIVFIPIAVPTGHSGVTVTFQGSTIKSIDTDMSTGFGLGCGYYLLGAGCQVGDQFHGVAFISQGP